MRFFIRLFNFFAILSGILLFWGSMTLLSLIGVIANEQTLNRYGNRCTLSYPPSIDSILMKLEFSHYATSIDCNTFVIEGFVPKDYSLEQYQAIVLKLAILSHEEGIDIPMEILLNGDYIAFARLTSSEAITFVAHPNTK